MPLRLHDPEGPRWAITSHGDKVILFATLGYHDADPPKPGVASESGWTALGSSFRRARPGAAPDARTLAHTIDTKPNAISAHRVVHEVDAPRRFATRRFTLSAPHSLGEAADARTVWLIDRWHHFAARLVAILTALAAAWIVLPILPQLATQTSETLLPVLAVLLFALVPGTKETLDFIKGQSRDQEVGGWLSGLGHRLAPTLAWSVLVLGLTTLAYLTRQTWLSVEIYNATPSPLTYGPKKLEPGASYLDHSVGLADLPQPADPTVTAGSDPSRDNSSKENPVWGALKNNPTLCIGDGDGAVDPTGTACTFADPRIPAPAPLLLTFLRPHRLEVACKETPLHRDFVPVYRKDIYACNGDRTRLCPRLLHDCALPHDWRWELSYADDTNAKLHISGDFALDTHAEDGLQISPPYHGTPGNSGENKWREGATFRITTQAPTLPAELEISLVKSPARPVSLRFPNTPVLRFDLSYRWGPRSEDRTSLGEGFYRLPSQSARLSFARVDCTPNTPFELRRTSEALWTHAAEDTGAFLFPTPAAASPYVLTLQREVLVGDAVKFTLPDDLKASQLELRAPNLAGGQLRCELPGTALTEVVVAAFARGNYDFGFESTDPNTQVIQTHKQDKTITALLCKQAASPPDRAAVRVTGIARRKLQRSKGDFQLLLPAAFHDATFAMPIGLDDEAPCVDTPCKITVPVTRVCCDCYADVSPYRCEINHACARPAGIKPSFGTDERRDPRTCGTCTEFFLHQ